MNPDFKYCQSEIEEQGRCEEQCDHCKLYYAPIEAEYQAYEKYPDGQNFAAIQRDAFIAGFLQNK